MMQAKLLLVIAFVALLSPAYGHKAVLTGAKLDRASFDRAPFIGGQIDLQQDDMVLVPPPLVGHPPMVIATMSADVSGGYPVTDRALNFYENAAKDRLPNTIGHSASTYNEHIYVVGGLIGPTFNTVEQSFQRFNVRTYSWETIETRGVPRLWGHCSVVYLNYLIITGGRTDNNANTAVYNQDVYSIDLDNLGEGFISAYTVPWELTDSTCYVADSYLTNGPALIIIGGEGSYLDDDVEVRNEITHLDVIPIISANRSQTVEVVDFFETTVDCGYSVRFGADGDFWTADMENGLQPVFFFVIGGFEGRDEDDVPYPRFRLDTGYVLLYDSSTGACYETSMQESLYPYFPKPSPVYRYSFNSEWASIARNFVLGNRDSYESIHDDFEDALRGQGAPQPLNEYPSVEWNNTLHTHGKHYGGFARFDDDWTDENSDVFTFEIFFTANAHYDGNITRLLDVGQRYDLPPGSLGHHTLGLFLTASGQVGAYITGSKEIIYNDFFETIQDGIDRIEADPRRHAYASWLLSPDSINFGELTNVVVNFNHRDYTMNIFVDGVLKAEGPMVANPHEIARNAFIYVGRSLNDNGDFGEFYFNGTITELRLYDKELRSAEIGYSISRGPNIAPESRGYHIVWEYEGVIFLAGGQTYNAVPLRPYQDAWSFDTFETTGDPADYVVTLSVDRTGPVLDTLEFPRFVNPFIAGDISYTRSPMNNPIGTHVDLSAL